MNPYSFLQNPQVQLLFEVECAKANFVHDKEGRLYVKWDLGYEGFDYQELKYRHDADCVIENKATIRTKKKMMALNIGDNIRPMLDICGALYKKDKKRVLVLAPGEREGVVALKVYFP